MNKTCEMVPVVLIVLQTSWVGRAADPNTVSQKAYPDPSRFEHAIKTFEESDRVNPPPQGAIVCIGSSSIRFWHNNIRSDLAPLTIVPRGFGGSMMNDALAFAGRIVMPYRPRAVVVYEGDNDIAGGILPQTIRDAFKAFVDKVHNGNPEIRIYFLSIKPSPSRWALWPRMKEANRLVAEVCARDARLTYVDVAAGMLDADGQVREDIFLEDKLHMNRKGYMIWRDILGPVLHKAERRYEPKRGAAADAKPAAQPLNP
jgi:lysophospholipase L1-like esterase